jgi:16S rRNA processing protein RimM
MELIVGRIGRPHGLRGDVTVEVRTDHPDDRFGAGSVLVTEPAAAGPLTVSAARWHSGRLLLRFAGFEDRDRAESLRGLLLVVDSAQRPPSAEPDTFADHELIGLRVLTTGGEDVGVVAEVLHHGQNLLVINGAGAREGAQILVPFVLPLVPEVDVAAGRLTVDPPPGLLDPDAAV